MLAAWSPRTVPAQVDDHVVAKVPAILRSEFVAPHSPTASVHASTIVELPNGLLAAWFGGTREGAQDVGIWMVRHANGAWSEPIEVANGVQPDGSRLPCYNPVLFYSADDVLHLFYKVGPQPAKWWGMHAVSRDEGRTWSHAERLPDGIIGPVKNKPIVLDDGTIVSGGSTESLDAVPVWRVHFEISRDHAQTWTAVFPGGAGSRVSIAAIQPSILRYANGTLQAIGRTRSGRLFETWSRDRGVTWSALSLTAVRNPNSGTDAVTLRDHRQLLVYNNSTTRRSPLNVAISTDGIQWNEILVLENEPGEFSYPAVIQTRDGRVHITYTWKRMLIKHVVIDPALLIPQK